MYARTRVTPKLHNIDVEKISNLFVDLRRESKETGSFPITVRHLESTLRMAEASARMHLREYVRADDVNLAIKVATASFVSAQKTSIRKSLERVCLSLLLTTSWPNSSCRASVNTFHSLVITKSYWPSCWAKPVIPLSVVRSLPASPSTRLRWKNA